MNHTHHRLRIKEPATKLPKYLDKEAFMNAVNRGDIPIRIPNSSNPPDEYLRNFNGIAKYCSFRGNQSHKSPDLFTWTLKQQQFNPIDIPKAFLNKSKKGNSTQRKNLPSQMTESNISMVAEKPKEREPTMRTNIVLNPPKRLQVYNAHMYSEKEIRRMEQEEQEYEDKINNIIKNKWGDIIKNANALRHRKLFSITKMQNNALYDESASFMDTMIESTGMSNYSQKNHFLNPFDKKNFGINKIIHYIKEKDEDEEIKSVMMQSSSKSIKSIPKIDHKEKLNRLFVFFKLFLVFRKLDAIHQSSWTKRLEDMGSGILRKANIKGKKAIWKNSKRN